MRTNLYKNIDKLNMYESIFEFPNHIKDCIENFENNCFINNKNNFDSIIILGMGGSAISGLLIKEILNAKAKIPIHVNKNYTIPKWVNRKTLVIASSYSGNTEETIISCKEALKLGCNIIGISTGGKLIQLLKKGNKSYIKLKAGLQPRAAIGYSFSSLLLLFDKLNLINKTDFKLFKKNIIFLSEETKKYCDVNKNNIAYLYAEKLIDKIPIIYAEDGIYDAIAYRFKSQLAENSKIISFNGNLPEMNHNEIEGFSQKIKLSKHIVLIWLDDELCHKRNKKRISITSSILKQKINNQIFLKIDYLKKYGEIIHYLRYIQLTDWISYYCAILKEIDPSDIPYISKLKNTL